MNVKLPNTRQNRKGGGGVGIAGLGERLIKAERADLFTSCIQNFEQKIAFSME